jgi:16S rRNA (uracil1498-N3)-methyltransferase
MKLFLHKVSLLMKKKHSTQTTFFYSLFEINDTHSYLRDDEFKHAKKVLRLKVGDNILVTNGKGCIKKATLESLESDSFVLEHQQAVEHLPPQISLAMSILKGKDSEDVIDDISPLNLLEFLPLHCKHTDSIAQKRQSIYPRMQAKCRVALKQAKKAYETKIRPPTKLLELDVSQLGTPILLDIDGEPGLQIPKGKTTLFCGPEGGFSKEEVEWIMNLPGAQKLSLGNTRLRAKTAPLFAMGWIGGLSKGLVF